MWEMVPAGAPQARLVHMHTVEAPSTARTFRSCFRHLAGAACVLFSSASPAQGMQESFSGAALPGGWRLEGTAALTAPALDASGSGWLRLTDNKLQARGSALYGGQPFAAGAGFVVSFQYAAWGGGSPGADGISLFLFDASADMSGATSGGGLGFCKGAGGWLALALDEFGNFSHPSDGCSGGAGPGTRAQSVVLRGPVSAGNPYLAGATVPARLDAPQASQRPPPAQVVLTARRSAAGPGYRLSVDWHAGPGQDWTRLLNEVDFPYAAPAALRVGVAASTGAARNIHEVRGLSIRPLEPPTLSHVYEPSQIAPGGRSTLILRFAGKARAELLDAFTYQLPGDVRIARPPRLGGTCPGVVTAAPGGNTLRLHGNGVIRPTGCTVTVQVTSSQPGEWTGIIEQGSLITEFGSNASRSTATFTVRAP